MNETVIDIYKINKDITSDIKTAVIVLNWNNASDTQKCLNALEASNTKAFVVVVDNASTQVGIDEVCQDRENLVLLKSKENLGFGRGNNLGIKWALEYTKVDYIFILNNDAFVEVSTITKLQAHLDQNLDVVCVTPQIVFADKPDVIWYAGGVVNRATGSVKVWRWGQPKETTHSVKEVSFVSGCAMMLRRKVLVDVGGFDPRYFMYEEDVEYSFRLANKNYKVDYLSSAVVYHRVQGSQREPQDAFLNLSSPKNPKLPFFMYHRVSNRLMTIKKYMFGINKIRSLGFFYSNLLYQTVRFLVFFRFDAIIAILRGHQNFWKIRNKKSADEFKL